MKLPIVPSDDHLKVIGTIVANFSVLDEVISSWIALLIDTDSDTSDIVTAELSFAGKVALLSSLHRHRIEERSYPSKRISLELEEMTELVKKISTAEEKRNTILHSFWVSDEKPGTAKRYKTTAKRKTGLRFHSELVTVESLSEVAASIADVTTEVLMSRNDYAKSL